MNVLFGTLLVQDLVTRFFDGSTLWPVSQSTEVLLAP